MLNGLVPVPFLHIRKEMEIFGAVYSIFVRQRIPVHTGRSLLTNITFQSLKLTASLPHTLLISISRTASLLHTLLISILFRGNLQLYTVCVTAPLVAVLMIVFATENSYISCLW